MPRMLVASTLPYAALRLIKHVVCHTHDAVLLCVAQDQLKSIRYCVQETCNFDVLYAYLSCGNCTPLCYPCKANHHNADIRFP